jgi:protein TonB
MSAGVAQAPVRPVKNSRRFPRFPLSVPTDVTVLRSGIPCTIPGRSITIGERGLGVVLAGEVQPGDPVGLEFHLPDSGGRLRLKAVVRYQALLQCGLEFLNMTAEQQTLIEHWTRKKNFAGPRISPAATSVEAPVPQAAAPPIAAPQLPVGPPTTAVIAPMVIDEPVQNPRSSLFRPALWIVIAAALVMGGLGWWYWRQAWDELESQLPASKTSAQVVPTAVPADVMQKLILHKTEPIYPEAARRANIQGVVVLDTLIGSDGNVLDVRAVSGPDDLGPAAVDAVRWWRFHPYLVNGQAVQVKTALAVEFRGN